MPLVPRQSLGRPDFRFEVRPYDLSCGAGLYEAVDESRERVSVWMGWLHAGYRRQDAEDWAVYAINAWDAGNEFEFAIYDREDGRIAGSCGLNEMSKKDPVCNLGYWIRTSKARLGAATQAVTLLREFAFGPLDLSRVEIVVAEGNHASRGVAEKSGALYEGLQHSRVRVGEKIHDAHMYALIRPKT